MVDVAPVKLLNWQNPQRYHNFQSRFNNWLSMIQTGRRGVHPSVPATHSSCYKSAINKFLTKISRNLVSDHPLPNQRHHTTSPTTPATGQEIAFFSDTDGGIGKGWNPRSEPVRPIGLVPDECYINDRITRRTPTMGLGGMSTPTTWKAISPWRQCSGGLRIASKVDGFGNAPPVE